MKPDEPQAGIAFLYIRTPQGENIQNPNIVSEAKQDSQVIVLALRLVGQDTTLNVAFNRGDFSRLCAEPNQTAVSPIRVAVILEQTK